MPVQLSMSLFPLYFLPGPSVLQSNGPKGKSGRGLLLLFLPPSSASLLFACQGSLLPPPRGALFSMPLAGGVPLREEEEEGEEEGERASFISLPRSIDRSAGMEKREDRKKVAL